MDMGHTVDQVKEGLQQNRVFLGVLLCPQYYAISVRPGYTLKWACRPAVGVQIKLLPCPLHTFRPKRGI